MMSGWVLVVRERVDDVVGYEMSITCEHWYGMEPNISTTSEHWYGMEPNISTTSEHWYWLTCIPATN